MNALGIAILALIVVILVALIRKPNAITFAISAMCVLLYCLYAAKSGADAMTNPTEPPAQPPAQPADIDNSEKHVDFSAGPCEEKRAEPAPLPSADKQRLAEISRSNLFSLDQIYGRRFGGTIDDALYVHKQRIGDRDRQATINQIRSRRDNVYEPYFRQELSEHNSIRWWEPDDVLATTLDKRQLDTLEMGRNAVWDADIDGIYSQQ